ncbi:MAG: helix-turn-helix transcriptional regulator [Alphaproteobacteria bacterium]|nr:helix-turn-helix transcriptional regulator [Alphaproteobacteria bacterium]MBU1513094.1 helix-turn-helix transcriptional regulator [Alphaproteobacteria bacterium]MBU2095202.1 helix-turn-helix transcriptional regulator [Alphaproteobacteria bacterium]MBU2150639.1 helix-turn-helix transcriptional regulator [Alphaproteobacteria bacterium]MBU2306102.1 helix-turn-helix transcriptional regulator [Alphaproteobacteria bacterium]
MSPPKFIRTCSIWRALEVVGDTSVLLIIEAAWIGARRFDQFRTRTGLLQTLLSDRLKRLVAAEVFEKVIYSESPPRFEYRLTRKGRDLYWPALMMLRWERRWVSPEGKLQLRMHHRTCGNVFEPVPTCLKCGDEISARDVDWTEGPGVGWMSARYSRRRQQRHAAEAASGLMVDVAQITGDRWASLILRSIFTGLRRFDEIHRDTAMATNILSERLSWLTAQGVIRAHDLPGRRSEYRLTEKGIDYYPVLLMLLQWGDKYYVSPEGPPLVLRHKADGHDLEPAVTCSCCSQPVEPHDVTFEVIEAAPKPELTPA